MGEAVVRHDQGPVQGARIVARRVLAAVDRLVPGEDSTMIVFDIARLTSMVVCHCAAVDRALLARATPATRTAGERADLYRSRQQFGGLVDLSRIFHRRWGSSAAIAADPVDFRIAVHQLVYAIEEQLGAGDATIDRPPRCELDIAFAEIPVSPPIRSVS